MPDPGPAPPTPPKQEPWFIADLRGFVRELLYDRTAVKRHLVVALAAIGALVKSGGVVPGTEVVVPIPAWLAPRGDLLLLASLWLATGGRLPRLNGKAKPPP